jgi:hypothetical protein
MRLPWCRPHWTGRMPGAEIVFHLPRDYLHSYAQTAHLSLFRRIAAAYGEKGVVIRTADRRAGPFEGGPDAAAHYGDGNLHIIDMGRVQAPGVLNAAISYMPPFWHLDPAGVQAESGIGARTYDAAQVPYARAAQFFELLRARLVQPRLSRRTQIDTVTDFPADAIAMFLQGTQPADRGLTYCSTADMLRAVVAGAQGRPVLVKPHPLGLDHDVDVIDNLIAEGHRVHATIANVHDMIAACVATVSFNSAVALEGFLHRKPAILFGPSDFHHFCETVRDPVEFPQALDRALARPSGGYAQFLYWYFEQNCLNLHAPTFDAHVARIFADAGFPPERLGIA